MIALCETAPTRSSTPSISPGEIDDERMPFLQLAHYGHLIIVNASGTIEYMSDKAVTALEREASPRGEHVAALFHHQDIARMGDRIGGLLTGELRAVDETTRMAVGNRWMWFKTRAARFRRHDTGTPFVVLFFAPLTSGRATRA